MINKQLKLWSLVCHFVAGFALANPLWLPGPPELVSRFWMGQRSLERQDIKVLNR